MVHHVHSALYRGQIDVHRAVMMFDDMYKLSYCYVPVVFQSCLLNFKKDLFAVFSGPMSLVYNKQGLSQVKGHIVIERSQLKENIFSDAFQKNIFAFTSNVFETTITDMACDVHIQTKDPIRIETAFFQAQAKTALHIAGTVETPELSGSIELLSGSLFFPYKPLTITKGQIIFVPGQLHDPLIELVAKNTIKKFNVSLQVHGSMLQHDITLESSPTLTEEQIIALLLVGSQQDSLNIVMPALITQNITSLLFTSDHSPSKLNNFFKSLLKPLKNINFVPSFSDQTGRGGLRGTLEIDINERLKAMVQSNLSLSEDTKFEVEYLLSDDVSLRGIRNERCDVGTEVEMRWKFGS